jgi:hypothetical protein
MKLTRHSLKKLILEELASVKEKNRLSDTSVDDQIDSILIGFESKSSIDVKEESRKYSLARLLEAPEDEEEGEEDADLALDDEGVEFGTSADITATKAAEPSKPKLDIDQFAQRVSRLVENYTNLLDVETVILTRSKNYLMQNYGKDIVDAFEDTLEKQYGLSLDPPDNEQERPAAAGAGPSV